MNGNIEVKPGSLITLRFRLSLENGFTVDEVSADEPYQFEIGDGSLEPELEQVLFGHSAGQKGKIHFAAGEVFGNHLAENIHQIPREEFADMDSEDIKKGVIISFHTPSDEEVAGMIIDLDEKMVTVDFNHPLSGKAFNFEFEILEVG